MKKYAIYLPNSTEVFKVITGELAVFPSGMITIVDGIAILAVVPKEYLVIEIV